MSNIIDNMIYIFVCIVYIKKLCIGILFFNVCLKNILLKKCK